MTFPEEYYTRSPLIPLKKGDFDSEAPLTIGVAVLKELGGWGDRV
jgi:hypothetical protein